MNADKMSISLDSDLAVEARAAATHAGKGLSAWVADAIAAKLRSEALAVYLEDWQREYGPLTGEELERARAERADAQARAGRDLWSTSAR